MIFNVINILPYSIYFLLILCNIASATPYEAFPISKQYPPIARVNQTFTFQISNDTYMSSVNKNIPITYQAFNLPSWLSFDSNTRTFNGMVTEENVKNLTVASNLYYFFDIILQGTDESDMTSLNCTYRFVISDTKDSIKLVDNFNLLAVLKNFGNTNGENGLILPPNEMFNVTFEPTLFQNPSLIKKFYGRSKQYNSPLPNWLFFNSDNLEFSGTTPVINSEIAPEMYYNLVLIATEIEGYSSVEIPFSLIIGAHQLTTSIQNTILLNVTENGDFKYNLPLNYVYLDGSPINSTDLGSIDLVNAPSWVSLSNTTDHKYLSGTLSNDTTDNKFSVAIYDKYDDVIYLNFEVESTTNVFAVQSLPNLNAIRNEWFQYNFLPSQFTDSSKTEVSLVYLNSTQNHSWLNFKSDNLTLEGWVPSNFNSLSVGLIARKDSLTQQLNFSIIGINGTSRNTTTKYNNTSSSIPLLHNHLSGITTMTTSTKSSAFTSLSTTISPSSSSTNGTVPLNLQNKSSHNNHKKTVAIACGVVIPVVVFTILLLILFFFWRSRKQARDTNDPDEPFDGTGGGIKNKNKTGMVKDISGPMLNNPANKPNQTLTSLENPFEDEKNILSDQDLVSSENNPFKLGHDTVSPTTSSSSNSNFMNEKMDNQSSNRFVVSSGEELLPQSGKIITPSDVNQMKTTSMVNPFQNRTSSFYLDTLPASKQSWRYNPDYTGSKNTNNVNRESLTTLNTVSTAELLNTELKPNESIMKDPKKSTFALRDSMFWENGSKNNINNNTDNNRNNRGSLGPLTELSSVESITTSNSISSTDDFIPVKEGETYNWIHRNSSSRKSSQTRLVNLVSQSDVNVGKAQDVVGHVPEVV